MGDPAWTSRYGGAQPLPRRYAQQQGGLAGRPATPRTYVAPHISNLSYSSMMVPACHLPCGISDICSCICGCSQTDSQRLASVYNSWNARAICGALRPDTPCNSYTPGLSHHFFDLYPGTGARSCWAATQHRRAGACSAAQPAWSSRQPLLGRSAVQQYRDPCKLPACKQTPPADARRPLRACSAGARTDPESSTDACCAHCAQNMHRHAVAHAQPGL